MALWLAFLKKYFFSAAVVFVLAAQAVSVFLLYFKIQNVTRASESAGPAPLPAYSPLTPTPRAATLKDAVGNRLAEPPRPATATAEKSACNCPPGPAGPQGEKGEKGDKGDPGANDLTGGRWAIYCQSKLGPVRQKPSYGCDTGNANADYKESEFQVWVK